MGHVLAKNASEQGFVVVAGVDRVSSNDAPFVVYDRFESCPQADVIIDFSHPSTLPVLLNYAIKNKIPVVIATTGMSEDDIKKIHLAAQEIPVFFTFNMSLGVNLLAALTTQAAKVLGSNFDIEIVEKHHNKKIDAPSGTAVMLADAVADGLSYTPKYVYERHSVRRRRAPDEIGMHSIRGGTIVGEHSVIFAGEDEVITLSHSAFSKSVFAVGALGAAKFISSRSAGLYSMKELLAQDNTMI
jgi:4-hydroxy-tetrahydrodipicolinate reductase